MRIRTIKPAFWRSLTLARLPREVRLFFVGLWNYVDDHGRGLADARLIKGDLFPLDDDIIPRTIQEWSSMLREAGLLVLYRGEKGESLLAVRTFGEHQRVDKPQKSQFPEPPAVSDFQDDSGNDLGTIQDQSALEGKGKEGKGKEGNKDSGGVSLVAQKWNVPQTYELVTSRIASIFAEVAASGKRSMKIDELREVQAEIVFAYWAAKLNHQTALLDIKRVNRIKARLRENGGDVHELLFVVDGAKKDDHLMGRNGDARKYDGIETVFRDRGQVERLALQGGYKSGAEHPMAKKYASIVEEP